MTKMNSASKFKGDLFCEQKIDMETKQITGETLVEQRKDTNKSNTKDRQTYRKQLRPDDNKTSWAVGSYY